LLGQSIYVDEGPLLAQFVIYPVNMQMLLSQNHLKRHRKKSRKKKEISPKFIINFEYHVYGALIELNKRRVFWCNFAAKEEEASIQFGRNKRLAKQHKELT